MAWQSLVIGVIIGWLIELAIDFVFWRKRRICSDAEEELQETVDLLKEEVDRLNKKCVEMNQPEGKEKEDDEQEEEEKEKEPDDLKKIWGIGPKIEVLFNLNGIKTFEMLALADHRVLEKILDAAGPRYKLTKHNVIDSWNEQARLAADGRWQELETYQSKLSGIRRRRRLSRKS